MAIVKTVLGTPFNLTSSEVAEPTHIGMINLYNFLNANAHIVGIDKVEFTEGPEEKGGLTVYPYRTSLIISKDGVEKSVFDIEININADVQSIQYKGIGCKINGFNNNHYACSYMFTTGGTGTISDNDIKQHFLYGYTTDKHIIVISETARKTNKKVSGVSFILCKTNTGKSAILFPESFCMTRDSLQLKDITSTNKTAYGPLSSSLLSQKKVIHGNASSDYNYYMIANSFEESPYISECLNTPMISFSPYSSWYAVNSMFGSTYNPDMTVLSPILVPGVDNCWLDGVYFNTYSQVQEECIIELNGKRYWTNGIISVEE